MNHLKIAQGIAGATALATMLAFAAPAMAQNATTYPPGTNCSKFTGAAMTQCKNQQPRNSSNVVRAPAPGSTNGGANGTNGSVNGTINGTGTSGTSGTGTSSGSGGTGSSGN